MPRRDEVARFSTTDDLTWSSQFPLAWHDDLKCQGEAQLITRLLALAQEEWSSFQRQNPSKTYQNFRWKCDASPWSWGCIERFLCPKVQQGSLDWTWHHSSTKLSGNGITWEARLWCKQNADLRFEGAWGEIKSTSIEAYRTSNDSQKTMTV